MTFKSIAALGISALALTVATPALAEDAPATATATPAPTPLPTMSFGSWGFDPADIDPSIDPGDDFFAYANSRWLKANPLPPEFSRFGAFNLLREKSTSDVKALCLTGGSSRDTLTGYASNDRLVGGNGRDQLNGGAGLDTLEGDEGADSIWGAAGDDPLDRGALIVATEQHGRARLRGVDPARLR